MTWLARWGPLVRRVLALLPDGLISRLLGRRGWSGTDLTVAVAPETPIRLFVAPTNSAGQGWAWARAVERELRDVGAVDLAIRTAGSHAFSFPADLLIPETAYVFAAGWRARQHEALLGFTHVLLESGRFVYGNVPGTTPRDAAVALAAEGPRIALLWHGSDIRLPSRHAVDEPDSPFGSRGTYPAQLTTVLERNARANLALIDSTDFPVFVSTPDLLAMTPRSVWLPVVVDADAWSGAGSREPLAGTARPVVVHAPSNAGLKGTEQIRPSMQRLHDEGLIEYRELSGIPSREMPAAYGAADIVLDQFLIGGYGVAAVEAMAAGRIVIGHVGEDSRRQVRATTGWDLPVVEARFDELDAVVRTILASPDEYRRRGAVGPDFVRAVHTGRLSASVLADFLGASLTEEDSA